MVKMVRVMSFDSFLGLEVVEELLEKGMLVSSSNHLLMVMWMSQFDVRRKDHHFVQKKWELHIVSNPEIHGYDGRRLKRQSNGLFHDHFRVDGFVLEQVDA
ncbi:hypothetical protein Tco_1294199 [Tanacetum coccineum]